MISPLEPNGARVLAVVGAFTSVHRLNSRKRRGECAQPDYGSNIKEPVLPVVTR